MYDDEYDDEDNDPEYWEARTNGLPAITFHLDLVSGLWTVTMSKCSSDVVESLAAVLGVERQFLECLELIDEDNPEGSYSAD